MLECWPEAMVVYDDIDFIIDTWMVERMTEGSIVSLKSSGSICKTRKDVSRSLTRDSLIFMTRQWVFGPQDSLILDQTVGLWSTGQSYIRPDSRSLVHRTVLY